MSNKSNHQITVNCLAEATCLLNLRVRQSAVVVLSSELPRIAFPPGARGVR